MMYIRGGLSAKDIRFIHGKMDSEELNEYVAELTLKMKENEEQFRKYFENLKKHVHELDEEARQQRYRHGGLRRSDFVLDGVPAEKQDPIFKSPEDVRRVHDAIAKACEPEFEKFDAARRASWAASIDRILD